MEVKRYLKKGLVSLLVLGTIALSGCKKYKIRYSEAMHEEAVISKKYVSGEGINIPMWLATDNLAIGVATAEEEQYIINLKGERVSFRLNNRRLYKKFEEGQKVDVTYKEVYRVSYDDIDKDGEDEVLEKRFIKYKFLDAQPKN